MGVNEAFVYALSLLGSEGKTRSANCTVQKCNIPRRAIWRAIWRVILYKKVEELVNRDTRGLYVSVKLASEAWESDSGRGYASRRQAKRHPRLATQDTLGASILFHN